MKILSIHQPQYLPYLGFFHKLHHSDLFVALDSVQFQKNGLQNRNKIKTKDGWQWITVPTQVNLGQTIREVRIDRKAPWQRKHLGALQASYARAAYYKQFSPSLAACLEQEWETLSELNMALTDWAMGVLELKRPILYSSQLDVEGSSTELLVSICRAVGADAYLSGQGGKEYMELEQFEAAGITVIWQEFTPPVYDQVYPDAGFIPNLSIVDAIFNCGSSTRAMLGERE